MIDRRLAADLIMDSIDRLELDLTGLSVLTEAATGPYAVTAAIAAAAGAGAVYAISRDSAWGTRDDAEEATRAMAETVAPSADLTIVREAAGVVAGSVDIVTNLGSVRPIDAILASRLRSTAVISLMCEPWEVRPSDVDLHACARHGIAVVGTNENAPEWPVFSYSGPLAVQMLSEAGVDLPGARVAVLGRDRFAPVIASALGDAGAHVTVDRDLRGGSGDVIHDVDAIVVADYASDEIIVGPKGLVTTRELVEHAAGARVVQFAGAVDDVDLRANGFVVWPDQVVPARRMSRTFSALGVKPVIQLHAAGLRVGEAVARLRLQDVPPGKAVERVCSELPIAQPAVTHDAGASGT